MKKTKEEKPIKIIIVDDHPLVRHGISKIIDKEPDMQVCAEADNANEAIKLIAAQEPDVAIVDITLKGMATGLDLVKSIQERFNNIRSLVLSMHDETVYAERAIRAGARGYLAKDEASDNIIDAIRKIINGELFLSNALSATMVDKLIHGRSKEGTTIDLLSDRELEVFNLIGNGFATGEISKKLNLSVNTIESHRRNIKKKLQIKNSSELVKKAIQWILNNE